MNKFISTLLILLTASSCNSYVKVDSQESKPKLLPVLDRILKNVGENIKLARLRRKISSSMLAERMGTTRPTLRAIERGDSGVSMGMYAQALFCLGLQKDIERIAQDDVFGRKLQDIELLGKSIDDV